MSDVNQILEERGEKYGRFCDHAEIAQALKDVMRRCPNWGSLSDSMREALEMDMHKTARILNGDPTYLDSWVDKVGYTQLVIDELKGIKR